MKSKLILINDAQEWNQNKRYKINDIAVINGFAYQNITGVNSDPTSSLTDWVFVGAFQTIIGSFSNIGNVSLLPIYVPYVIFGNSSDVAGAAVYFAENSFTFHRNDLTELFLEIKAIEWYEKNVDLNSGFAITKQAQGTPTEDITRYEPLKSGPYAVVNTEDNYVNDAAASVGGIPVGGIYHTAGVVKIRLT